MNFDTEEFRDFRRFLRIEAEQGRIPMHVFDQAVIAFLNHDLMQDPDNKTLRTMRDVYAATHNVEPLIKACDLHNDGRALAEKMAQLMAPDSGVLGRLRDTVQTSVEVRAFDKRGGRFY